MKASLNRKYASQLPRKHPQQRRERTELTSRLPKDETVTSAFLLNYGPAKFRRARRAYWGTSPSNSIAARGRGIEWAGQQQSGHAGREHPSHCSSNMTINCFSIECIAMFVPWNRAESAAKMPCPLLSFINAVCVSLSIDLTKGVVMAHINVDSVRLFAILLL